MEPEPTLSKETIEATNKYVDERKAALAEKIRLAREKKSASQRLARSQQTEEQKSSERAKNAAGHAAAHQRETSDFEEQCRAARALCHPDMEDCPPPEALFNWDTCGIPWIALLAFWEQSGLESTPYASEIPDLLAMIQDYNRRKKALALRRLALSRALLVKVEAAGIVLPNVHVLRDIQPCQNTSNV